MKIFIAGATGTLGRPTTEALVKQGHEVVAMTRDAARAKPIAGLCAAVEVADAFDAPRVEQAMARHRPDAVMHLLTALPPEGATKARDIAPTNRLRTEGTRILLEAARKAGARRVVAESFLLAYGVGDFGEAPVAEDALPPVPSGAVGEVVAAARSLEEQVVAWGREGRAGVALRFGVLVGEGVPSFEAMKRGLAAGKVPIVGDGGTRLPLVRLDDAVDALVAALEAPTGVYNVADDSYPALGDLLTRWAPAGKPPRKVPYALARLLAPFGARFMTTSLRMSAQKARRELGWKPRPAP